jgi:hypothetical protein
VVLDGSSDVTAGSTLVASLVGSSAGVLSAALGSSDSVVSSAFDAGAGRSGVNIVGDLVPLWVEESNDAMSPRSMVCGGRRESVVCVVGMFRIRSGSVFRKLSRGLSRGCEKNFARDSPYFWWGAIDRAQKEPACQFQSVPFA